MTQKVNWNTLILTAGFALLGFLGKVLYAEVSSTHDTVIEMRARMVSREEFIIEIAKLQSRIVQMEVDILRLKSKN